MGQAFVEARNEIPPYIFCVFHVCTYIYIYIFVFLFCFCFLRGPLVGALGSPGPHQGLLGLTRARPMSAQGGPQGPGPQGPRGPTRAQGGPQGPMEAHKGPACKGPGGPLWAQEGPQGPGPQGRGLQGPSRPTRAQRAHKGPADMGLARHGKILSPPSPPLRQQTRSSRICIYIYMYIYIFGQGGGRCSILYCDQVYFTPAPLTLL